MPATYTCGPASQSISCSLDHLAAGGPRRSPFTTTSTRRSIPRPCDNTAHAASDEHTATPDTDSVSIVEDVVLSVDKTFNSDSATAGGAPQSFTIDVKNDGVSDADNVSLTDTVDSRLIVDSVTAGSYTCPDGDTNAQTITCNLAHLAAGDTKSITVTYHVDTTTNSDPSVGNTAHALSDEDTATPDTDDVAIVEDVHLSVSKTFASPTVTAGGAPSSFTISVTNSGLSDADNLNVTDNVDSRLIVDSVDANDYTCTDGDSNAQTITCSLDHLAAAATKSLTVHYHVDTATEADPAVPNTANASSDENAAAPSTTSVAILENVNLVVTKDFADLSVDAGTTGHTFTVTVQNTGVSQADNVSLTDTVDSRLIVTGVAEGDYTCPDGDSNPQTITCSLAHLNTGDTKGITVTYRVASSTPAALSVSNTANATADNGGAGSATDTVEITTHADVADLKTAASTVIAGNDLTFQIDVTNIGPSDAQNVTLNDTLDAQLNNAMYCEGSGCTPGSAWTGSDFLGTIAAGTTVHVTIKATVDPSTDEGYEIDNTALVTSATPDPNTANNHSDTTTTVQTEADLSISKLAPTDTVAGSAGGFDYTLTVHNGGPSDNTGGFTVTDTLQAGLTFQTAGSSADCSASRPAGHLHEHERPRSRSRPGVHRARQGGLLGAGRHGAREQRVGRFGRHDRSEPGQHEQHDAHDRARTGRPVGLEARAGDRDCGRSGRLRLHADRAQRRPVRQRRRLPRHGYARQRPDLPHGRLVGDVLGCGSARHLHEHHGSRRRCGRGLHRARDAGLDGRYRDRPCEQRDGHLGRHH